MSDETREPQEGDDDAHRESAARKARRSGHPSARKPLLNFVPGSRRHCDDGFGDVQGPRKPTSDS